MMEVSLAERPQHRKLFTLGGILRKERLPVDVCA